MDKIKSLIKEVIYSLTEEIDKFAFEDEDTYKSFMNGHQMARLAGAKIALQTVLMVLNDESEGLVESSNRVC